MNFLRLEILINFKTLQPPHAIYPYTILFWAIINIINNKLNSSSRIKKNIKKILILKLKRKVQFESSGIYKMLLNLHFVRRMTAVCKERRRK